MALFPAALLVAACRDVRPGLEIARTFISCSDFRPRSFCAVCAVGGGVCLGVGWSLGAKVHSLTSLYVAVRDTTTRKTRYGCTVHVQGCTGLDLLLCVNALKLMIQLYCSRGLSPSPSLLCVPRSHYGSLPHAHTVKYLTWGGHASSGQGPFTPCAPCASQW